MLRLRNQDQAEASLATWRYGILGHKIVDCMRATGRYEPNLADDAPFPDSDPEELFLRRRFLETVERSLKRLPAGAARVSCCARCSAWTPTKSECPDLRGLAADAI